jgi:hypothetical protein
VPALILLLIAMPPLLATVSPAGATLGDDIRTMALVALVLSLATLVAWLLKESVRAVTEKLRRTMSRPYS